MKLCRVINVMFWIFASLEEYSQVLSWKLCAGQYELDVVANSQISYRNAKRACETAGSRLVILDETISKKITENFACGKKYYVGLRWENSQWTWADGSTVSQNSLPWFPSEPNNPNERCVKMNCEAQLIDVFCYQENYYICQKNSSISIDSEDELALKEKQTYDLSCRASSCKTPTVSWLVNGAEVPADRNGNNVYQIKSAGSSILRLQNVDISLPSRYNCRANTEALPIKNHYTAIDVEGTPTVSEIFAGRCRSNITILWKPHQLAVNFPHRITAKSNLDDETKSITVTPERRENQSTTIKNLSPSILYSVQISACKHISTCSTTKYTTNSYTAITGKRSGPVTKIKASEANNTCNVSWTPPQIARDEIIRYVVNISENVLQFRENIADTEFLISNETREWHFFTLRPNRVYSVQVQAMTCAGVGAITKANGSCVGSPKAPSTLKPPVITTSDNETKLTIEIPDESDGLISCLFVIVSNSSSALNEANTSDFFAVAMNSNASLAGYYIASAISYSRFVSKRIITVALGINSTTNCNIYHAGSGNANDVNYSDSDNILGRNYRLSASASYRVYVVAAVPDERDVSFRWSTHTVIRGDSDQQPTVTKTNNPGSQPGAWSTGIIIASVVILLLAIAIFFFIRRRKNIKTSVKNDQGFTTQATPMSSVGVNQAMHLHSSGIEAPTLSNEESTLYENYTPPANKYTTSIPIFRLESVYRDMGLQNNAGLSKEFAKILKESAKFDGSQVFAANAALKSKNRYKNILPFDASRVPLQADDVGYINACYIDGFGNERKFIATQGPLTTTVRDFWLMVLEQKTNVIVMLTREFEGGKKKCEMYWPELGQQMACEYALVKNIDEVDYYAFTRRTFLVSPINEEQEPLAVSQYQFMKWPDHGSPTTTSSLVRMHRAVMQTYDERRGPIIVHCSAGAGRTGTFIGYDRLLEESMARGEINAYECVMDMRRQRVKMVQTYDQYMLLHKLLLEAYLFKDTDSSPKEVQTKYANFCSPGGKEMLVKEYQDLDRIPPMNISVKPGGTRQTIDDSSRVTVAALDGEIESPRINASWVEHYGRSQSMIATPAPTEATINVFWRAVHDNSVGTIVMLTSGRKTKGELCLQYWPSERTEELVFSGISVTLIASEGHGPVIERKIQLEREGEKVALTQLHLTSWPNDSDAETEKNIINLVLKMRRSLQPTPQKTALVHCSDGVGRTGAFCTIVNLMDRLELENCVDVFRTVKDLRDGRPNMVNTVDLYKFCYEVIIRHVNSFEIYQNV